MSSASSGYLWLRDEARSIRERFARVIYLVQELMAEGSDDEARKLFTSALDFLSTKHAWGEIPGATIEDAGALLERWPSLRAGAEGERRVTLLAHAKRQTMELRFADDDPTNRIKVGDE